MKIGEMKLYEKGYTKNEVGYYKRSQVSCDGYIKHIDRLSTGSRIVYGTSKGHIEVADCELSCLSPEGHYEYAHTREVTGVSNQRGSLKCWASCSLDRNCLIWDTDLVRPASGILRDHVNEITALAWTSQEENKQMIMIGDEIGNVLTIDPRTPNQILSTVRVSNRAIEGMFFNGSKQFGVLSKSNVLEVMEVDDCGDFKSIHKHEAPVMLYSMCWDDKDKKTFYVVGESKCAEKITLA